MKQINLLPLAALAALLTACAVNPNAPLGLQATNAANAMSALQATQAAYFYAATQTPEAATQAAMGTEMAFEGQIHATQAAMDFQATGIAIQMLADGATATQSAVSTQQTYSLQATQAADQMTQVAWVNGATATQASMEATATQTALDFARKEKINGAIAWTPIVISLGFMVFIWRLIVVFENRKSMFFSPSGELIFSRRAGVPEAVSKTLIRRALPEVVFDEFAMPGRAAGHAIHQQGQGYATSQSQDRGAQLQIIMQEQLRIRGVQLPGPGPFDLPQLPPYTGLLGEAGEIETVSPDSQEISPWIIDIEDQQE